MLQNRAAIGQVTVFVPSRGEGRGRGLIADVVHAVASRSAGSGFGADEPFRWVALDAEPREADVGFGTRALGAARRAVFDRRERAPRGGVAAAGLAFSGAGADQGRVCTADAGLARVGGAVI